MKSNNKAVLVTGVLMLASAPAWAQDGSASTTATAAVRGIAAPSFNTPIGFGASWGAVGFGVGGQTGDFAKTGGGFDHQDGSAAVVIGLGDAVKYAGLEVTAVTGSLLGDHGSGDSFGESGSLSFKLHTALPGNASFAVGVVGTGRWGSDSYKDQTKSSVYAAATKVIPVGPFVTALNIGIGDEAYNEPGKSGAGVFGSGALYFTPQVSVIAEYTGRFTNAALSVAPFKSFPLTVSLAAINLGERYGGNVEFGGSIGVGFSFL